ncbi:PQQ-dependent sugar dehydrogenase, partial [Georgenia sp. MJ170]
MLSAALVLPLTISGAQAHSEHAEDPAAGAEADTPAVEADAETDWNDYEKILLTKNTGEPIDLAVLPDSRVLHTARDGVVRLTDPETAVTQEVAQVDVYANSEDGLQGIAIDPNFEENNWVYMAYAPRVMSGTSPTGVDYPETTPSGSAPEQLPEGEDESYWDQWLGYNVLSRFQWDPETSTLDLDSEQQIIKVDAQRGQCCHVGADIAFDGDGNLYLSTGDNTPASTPGADGYTPINNAPGMNPGFDSRRGAGSTNDLRGAILRINVNDEIEAGAEPGPDSTYTIPEGNLFNSGDYDADLVREELYVMGLRNPFRIDYDIEAGALTWGDYGPDAGSAQDDRGPMGYVEWQLTTEPMNGGWPYCHGPNDGGAYNEWDYENEQPGDLTFDCDAGPVNNSTWNTGLEQLPPVTEPQIWYGDSPGDQPEAWDGLVTFTETGGQAPMGGPIYRFDEELDSPTKFPETWDGVAFMAEFSQDYIAAFEMDELSSAGEVTDIHNFLPNEVLETENAPPWSGIMDMEFGPDGSMYVLEYGKGFFTQNPEAGIYRIDHNPDNKTPRAAFTADPVSGSDAPLEVAFDASDSFDPEEGELTYEWDFDGDGEIDDEGVTVSHTYPELGQFGAVLHVTDPEGLVGRAVQQITVGNTAPEITLSVDDGAIFDWGDDVTVNVSVSDAEDGDTPECERVSFIFGLGHNEHAHPEVSGTADENCEFTLETNESAVEHGEGEKIFGSLVVNYTDEPQGEVPATTGETTLILKPEVQQAEWYDAADGISVADDSEASAGSYVTEFEEGDSLTFAPMALSHAASGDAIDTVTARGSGEGTISLSWGDAESSFADIEFTGGDGWQDVETALEEIPEGSGSVVVTSTGGVDLDALTFTASGETPGEPGEPDEPITVPADQVSIQMYSLPPWVEEAGLQPVLARLSEIGFENIEPYGGNFDGISAEDFRSMVDELGLSVPSSHYNTDEDTFDETLAYAETLGQEYMGSGGFAAPGFDSYEDTLATAETMNRLGQRSVDAGVGKFFGHNHDSEFTTTFEHNGEELSVWEILVDQTDPELVTFELDVAWAAHAGVDVPALIEEHGDRIEMLHIKDAIGLGEDDGPSFTNLGEGEVDLQGILAAARDHAEIAYYVLEFDQAPEGEDFVTTGFEYLTGDSDGEEPPPSSGAAEFHLSDNWRGTTHHFFKYGRIADEVFVGDWDGDGTDSIAVRRGNTFHVSNAPRGGDADWTFRYGREGDTVLVGDWDGDGADTFAVRRGSEYHVKNHLLGGDADVVFNYGRADDDV